MKLNTKNYNTHIYDGDGYGSEDEEENEEDEDDVNDDDNNGDSQEDDDEDGDELEDDEDEPPDTDAPNMGTAAAPKLKQSQQGADKKAVLKKQLNGETTKKAKQPISKLVIEAIKHLNERRGSSAVAIKRVIISNHPDMDERRLALQIKRHIKFSLENGTMMQIKRSFKITKKLDEIKKKLEKERLKARNAKFKEKAKAMMKNDVKPGAKEKDKNHKTNKKKSDDKEKAKPGLRPSPNNDKGKPIKKTKLDEATNKAAKTRTGKGESTKGPAVKATIKVKSRKSINLLVKRTPPRPKTMKKSKTVAGNQKSDLMANEAAAGTSKTATAATGRAKKTKAV